MTRARFAATIVLIGIGLVWRLVPLGLSGLALKYGGSVLWAAMIYCPCAALRPRGSIAGSIAATALIASLVALVTEEASRLFHSPWLDAFRLTLPGALLLERGFSLWDLVADAVGIGVAALCERIHAGGRRP